MTYLRSLFLNFLMVFFVNHSFPGIEILSFEDVPNIGGDILFSAIVGFLNSLIVPMFVLFNKGLKKTVVFFSAGFVSLGAYLILAINPMGIVIVHPLGFFLGGGAVWAMSYFTNYLELKHLLR
ncbi:MAG: hypothetical protein JW769_01260 [Parachlamydiales bacterium]|nr:hypothetical protein [Parachlamydiales bacterium]